MNSPTKSNYNSSGYFTIWQKTDVQEITAISHAHDCFEICYFEHGYGTYTVENKIIQIKSGDLVLINPQIKHQFSTQHQNLSVFNVLFSPNFVDDRCTLSDDFQHLCLHSYFADLWQTPLKDTAFYLINSRHEDVGFIINKIMHEYYQSRLGSQLLIKTYIIELIAKISRLLMTGQTNNSQKKKNAAIEHVIDYIHEHYDEHITLEQLASNISYSKNHLCKVFKATTSKTIYEYLNEVRITEACNMLHYTNRTLTDVCMAVGFTDYKYFTKNFIRLTGKKPSDYRTAYNQ